METRSGATLIRGRAGALSFVFEPATGWVRAIRLGDREVVRAIYGAVRDRRWRTVLPALGTPRVGGDGRATTVTFDARANEDGIAFDWTTSIAGAADDSLEVTFDGTARSTFLRNRIGLCVLHPIRDVAGRPCTIEHSDGTSTPGAFPARISPHQPFLDVAAMTWETPAYRARLVFSGEVFETEDQRNWTDASYKTYSTPLARPFPVEIASGTQVRQAVRLTVEPRRVHVAVALPAPVRLAPAGALVPAPRLGTCLPRPVAALERTQAAALAALSLDHVRVDLHASDDADAVLARAGSIAAALGARLHLALHLDGDPVGEAARAAHAARTAGAPLSLVLVYRRHARATDPGALAAAGAAFGADVPLASGTNLYFAELNRNRDSVSGGAWPCFSMNPQVHAFDEWSLIENLEAQAAPVETARAVFGAPVVASPLTLRPRFNFTDPGAIVVGPDGVPEHVDPRQHSAFAAAWTAGCLAELLPEPGLYSLTLFEAVGVSGLLPADATRSPVYDVLHRLAGAADVQKVATSDPQRARALLIQSAGAPDTATSDGRAAPVRRLLVASQSPEPVEVVVTDVSGAGGERRLILQPWCVSEVRLT